MNFIEHDAVVTRNTDDTGSDLMGSVYFQADMLLEDQEYPIPAKPCFQFASAAYSTVNRNEVTGSAGFFHVPEVGDFIKVRLFDTVSHANPEYLCMLYNNVNEIAREFKKNYTKRMGWKTKSGHIILFDDKKGSELLRIEHTLGSRINIDENGRVEVEARRVTRRDSKEEDKDTVDSKYQKLILDWVNNQIRLENDKGGALNIVKDKIAFGSKHELLDLIDQTLDEDIKCQKAIQLLTVPTVMGPSGVPINAATFAAIEASLTTIKSKLNEIKGML